MKALAVCRMFPYAFPIVSAVLFVAFSSLPHAMAEDSPAPVKVYILAGQSNMQGHAHVRTIDAMRLDPLTAPLLKKMRNADGSEAVCQRVWISSLGSSAKEQTGPLTTGFGAGGRGPKIGPEFTFGLTMQEHKQAPILIIKTAWGGKSLHTDFRSPSAGPYEFREDELQQLQKQGKDIEAIQEAKTKATGKYYGLMMLHINEVLTDISRVIPDYHQEAGYELAGFVWFQGWNDMVDRNVYPNRDQPGGYDVYSQLLTHFIHDVRKDLSSPELPFVIGVMGVGGPTDFYDQDQKRYQAVHQNFRDAMAAPAIQDKFQGNVSAVLTENFWDREVSALRKREQTLRPQIKQWNEARKAGELTKQEIEQKTEALYAATFTPLELERLKTSVSNFDFHYMGSAGVMARIGEAFALEVLKLE